MEPSESAGRPDIAYMIFLSKQFQHMTI